jgi:hypothetical protein
MMKVNALKLGLLPFVLGCSSLLSSEVKPHDELSIQQGTQSSADAPFGELREGAACISFFADMSPGTEVKIKTTGKGNRKKKQFFFQGSEVKAFPRPAEISITLSSHCKGSAYKIQPMWPEFVKHLRFSFRWDVSPTEHQIATPREVKPIAIDTQTSVWIEDKSMETRKFTLPAKGVGLDTHLNVDIYAGDRLLKTFVLFL